MIIKALWLSMVKYKLIISSRVLVAETVKYSNTEIGPFFNNCTNLYSPSSWKLIIIQKMTVSRLVICYVLKTSNENTFGYSPT